MLLPNLWTRFENETCIYGGTFTNNNAVQFNSGRFGNAAEFSEGSFRYLSSTFQIPSVFTLEFWIYDSSATDSIRRWVTTTLAAFVTRADVMIREQNSYCGFYVINHNGSYAYSFATPWSAAQKNVWHHIALTANSSNCIFYLDGVDTSGSQGFTGAGNLTFPNELYVGGKYSPNAEYMTGKIDNLKIWPFIKTDFSDRFDERGGMQDQASVV